MLPFCNFLPTSTDRITQKKLHMRLASKQKLANLCDFLAVHRICTLKPDETWQLCQVFRSFYRVLPRFYLEKPRFFLVFSMHMRADSAQLYLTFKKKFVIRSKKTFFFLAPRSHYQYTVIPRDPRPKSQLYWCADRNLTF